MKKILLIVICVLLLAGLIILGKGFSSISEKDVAKKNDNNQLSIPEHLKRAFPKTDWSKSDPEIKNALSGGPGRDGIPAIDKPAFVKVKDSQDQDGVQAIVMKDGDSHKVYPYSILVWHEIVNDTVNGTPVAVTFCPLCGSAIVYDRTLPDGTTSTFGVSGSLLESNMIMYDRETETLWQQSTGHALAGKHFDSNLNLASFQLLTMKEVRERFPNAKVLSRDTGYNRDYDDNPYSGYETSENFYFEPSISDSRYPSKAIFVAFRVDDKPVSVPLLALEDGNRYQTTAHSQVISIEKKDGEVFIKNAANQQIPFYYEMWFSWATQHGKDGIVYDPAQ